MVLLVLAVAWGGVLFFWLRSRSQSGLGDSVGTFHRHLHVLERTSPVKLAPANRLRGPSGPLPTVSIGRTRGATLSPPRLAALRRRAVVRRRRNVLFGLAGAALVLLLAAAATRSTAAIGLQLVADISLVAYVALLVRLRNLAAERHAKLRVIHQPRRQVAGRSARTARTRREPGYGSYEPGYAGELAYAGDLAYAGELTYAAEPARAYAGSLRRAVNS